MTGEGYNKIHNKNNQINKYNIKKIKIMIVINIKEISKLISFMVKEFTTQDLLNIDIKVNLYKVFLKVLLYFI